MIRFLCLLGFLLLVAASPLAAQAGARIPPPGSPERHAILEALRPPVQRTLGSRVVFHQVEIRVSGSWAFVSAEPRTPAGRRFQAFLQECQCDDLVYGLLRRVGGRWTLVDSFTGVTDVAYLVWLDRYPDAPRAIYPLPPEAPGA